MDWHTSNPNVTVNYKNDFDLTVKFRKLVPEAVIPKYAQNGDAGMDLTATSFRVTDTFIEFGTGIAVEIPHGYVGLLFPRSSITKSAPGVSLKNSVGVIDSNYRGEILVRFELPYSGIHEGIIPDVGDKVAQLIVMSYPKVHMEEVEKLAQDIDQAIRQGQMAAKQAGHGKGNQSLGLDELLESKVDWREQLQEFVRATCTTKDISTWRKPNRRYLHMDIIMPTMQGQSIKELVFAVDASGSMLGKPMQVVLSEVQGLAEQLNINKVHLIYWDGEVEVHEEYDAQSFKGWKNSTKPTGGGGTTPACIPAYLRKGAITPDAVVVLTDGEVCGWGEWDCPVLWAIYNPRNKITAPVGKTIHIED